MKHTAYLNGVLAYYENEGFHLGDGGKWEFAHTPMPRALGDNTVPLLHQHHVIHDLWQSQELDHPHFYVPNAERVLYSPNFWPKNWFELCDILDHYSHKQKSLGGQTSKPNNTFENYSKAGKIGGRKSQATLKKNQTGVYDPKVQQKAAKRGGQISNSRRYECLVTGVQSTGPGLSKYQNARGINTKLRKRIK
jgi:hypothetical protein